MDSVVVLGRHAMTEPPRAFTSWTFHTIFSNT